MAFIHHTASLAPSKLDLLSGWVTGRPWFAGGLPLTQLGAYRFDDPDGEVGIETFLLDAGGTTVHVPVTYRGAPLDGAALMGTTEHTVLGTRYVYDGCTDPVWATAVATAVLTGATHAEQYIDLDGRRVPRGSTATAIGSGTAETPPAPIRAVFAHDVGPVTVVEAEPYEVRLLRAPAQTLDSVDAATLTVSWPGSAPTVLVDLRSR